MRNKVLKLLSVMLVFVIFSTFLTVGVGAASAGELELNVKFYNEEYIPGEKVTAYIYLTGAADEAALDAEGNYIGTYIGGLSTQISFDSSLEFVSGEFNSDFAINDTDKVVFSNTTYGNKNIVNILLNKDTPVTVRELYTTSKARQITDNTKIELAELTFSVPELNEGSVGLKFEEVSLNDGSLPYKTDIIDEETEPYTLDIQTERAETTIKNRKAVIRQEEPYYENDAIYSEPIVVVTNDNGGVLLAKLYNKNTGMQVAPVIIKQLKKGMNCFLYEYDDVKGTFGENSIVFEYDGANSIGDLEVQYYIWDSMLTMRSLTESVTANVEY